MFKFKRISKSLLKRFKNDFEIKRKKRKISSSSLLAQPAFFFPSWPVWPVPSLAQVGRSPRPRPARSLPFLWPSPHAPSSWAGKATAQLTLARTRSDAASFLRLTVGPRHYSAVVVLTFVFDADSIGSPTPRRAVPTVLACAARLHAYKTQARPPPLALPKALAPALPSIDLAAPSPNPKATA